MQYPRLVSSFFLGTALAALGTSACSSSGDSATNVGGVGGDGGHSIQNGSSSDAGSGGSASGTGGGSSASSTTGASSTASSSTSAGTGTGGAGGGAGGCVELTTADLTTSRVSEDLGVSYYSAAFTPVLNPAVGYFIEYLSQDSEPGTFDLSALPDGDFLDCDHCFRVRPRSYNIGDRQFFQSSGSLTIASSSSAEGKIDATITDLTLVEIHFEDDHAPPTVVDGGQCLHIASAKIAGAGAPIAPAGWTCDPSYYGDGGCDCGCGVMDNDCFTQTDAVACEYCYQCGGGPADSCDTISATNTTACIPL